MLLQHYNYKNTYAVLEADTVARTFGLPRTTGSPRVSHVTTTTYTEKVITTINGVQLLKYNNKIRLPDQCGGGPRRPYASDRMPTVLHHSHS